MKLYIAQSLKCYRMDIDADVPAKHTSYYTYSENGAALVEDHAYCTTAQVHQGWALVNLPIMVVVATLAMRLMTDRLRQGKRMRADDWGAAWTATIVGALLCGVVTSLAAVVWVNVSWLFLAIPLTIAYAQVVARARLPRLPNPKQWVVLRQQRQLKERDARLKAAEAELERYKQDPMYTAALVEVDQHLQDSRLEAHFS